MVDPSASEDQPGGGTKRAHADVAGGGQGAGDPEEVELCFAARRADDDVLDDDAPGTVDDEHEFGTWSSDEGTLGPAPTVLVPWGG